MGSRMKMKGFFKGIPKYISHVFDEEKEEEIQIGLPTDVKHVAHIGWDGPAVETPSWMKKYNSPGQCQSAPLEMLTGGGPIDTPEIKWVSEDSKTKNVRKDESSQKSNRNHESTRDLPDMPKTTRHRRRSTENVPDPEGKDSSTKSRHSRRHQSKGSSDGSSKGRRSQELSAGDDSPKKLPDIPKKSRRRKSKESINGVPSKSSLRPKSTDSPRKNTTPASPVT